MSEDPVNPDRLRLNRHPGRWLAEPAHVTSAQNIPPSHMEAGGYPPRERPDPYEVGGDRSIGDVLRRQEARWRR